MKKWLFPSVVFILLMTSACFSPVSEPVKTAVPVLDSLPVYDLKRGDDLVPTPGGLAYRALVASAEDTEYWPAVETNPVDLYRAQGRESLNYRKNIETAPGETHYSMFYLSRPSGFSAEEELNFYTADLPESIQLSQYGSGGLWLPGTLASALIITVSENIEPGEHSFEIGLRTSEFDYGRFPVRLKIVGTPALAMPFNEPLLSLNLNHTMAGDRVVLDVYPDGLMVQIYDEGIRFPVFGNPATRTWKTAVLSESELNSLLATVSASGFYELASAYSFPGRLNESGLSFGDMILSITASVNGLTHTVNATGYLSPDGDRSFPDMPAQLSQVYEAIVSLTDKLVTVIQQEIPQG
ncbi:MAG: hypothetical protein P3T54_01985 [Dehalogenimonas sp.]|uniref:Lipoprotein n=1 Tax=Candidatus Dehalogenimonas loeffleri TaxID=3127115 RepID=A0ABZ2JA37_9CHLR|nr:hypothetical protein [Dehalogenimonas sp.]